jgi:hypothetical protein
MRSRRRAAGHPNDPAYCQSLNKDREDYHEVGEGQYQTA